MLISFFISLLGFMFAIRISKSLVSRQLFTQIELTKIGTSVFVGEFALAMFMRHSFFAVWCAVFLPIAIAAVALAVRISSRSREFKSDCASMLTIVLLKMKSGRSFRHSLAEVVSESDTHSRVKLSEIASSVAFSQQRKGESSDSFVRELVQELTVVDQQPHMAMRRLETFRDKLRTEDDFRRRSGQVLARIRAQSIVMSGLYIAVFAFMIAKFGWGANARLFIGSLFLFSAGALWLWFGGRKLKWTV